MGDALSPAYLAAWATQIGALSAFMGGFASTILVMLLTHDSRRRAVQWAAGLSALSAVAFIVAAVATTTLDRTPTRPPAWRARRRKARRG